MIIDHQQTHEQDMMSSENPPSYDLATSASGPSDKKTGLHKGEQPQQQRAPSYIGAGPSPSPAMVYYYRQPFTGEQITSLLPPDHPEMICLQQGAHVRETKFGILGVLAAIFWFPLGVGLCLLDRKVRCRRCGLTLDDGLCG